MQIHLGALRGLIREAIEQSEHGTENAEGRKELVVLVGPPGVGKSTWIASRFPPSTATVVSRDDIAEEVAAAHGLTVDDLFVTPPKEAVLGSTVPGMERFGKVVRSPAFMTWAPLSYEAVLRINDQVFTELQAQFDAIASSDKHVIIDMTNMNAAARKKALGSAKGNDFFKRAVVFTLSDANVGALKARVLQRAEEMRTQGRSKTIDPAAIDRILQTFQTVDPSEGFERIDTVDTFRPST